MVSGCDKATRIALLVVALCSNSSQAFLPLPFTSTIGRAVHGPLVTTTTEGIVQGNYGYEARYMTTSTTFDQEDENNSSDDENDAIDDDTADDDTTMSTNNAEAQVDDVDEATTTKKENENVVETLMELGEGDDLASKGEEDDEGEEESDGREAMAAADILAMNVTELQAQMEHWNRQEQELEEEYSLYIQQRMRELKLKPIYERQGKIDHYKARPVYDQETERLQLGRRFAHDKVQLTLVQLHVQQQVEQMKSTVHAQLQQEWKEQEEKQEREVKEFQEIIQQQEQDWKQKQEEWKVEAKQYEEEIQEAVQVQDEIREQAQQAQNAMQQQHEQVTAKLEESYQLQLQQKHDEMQRLRSDIQMLLQDLHQQKTALKESRQNATELAQKLQQTSQELEHLTQRHSSLRSLSKQGWSVLRGRVQKRLRRSTMEDEDEEGDGEEIPLKNAASQDNTNRKEDAFEAATNRMLQLAEQKKQQARTESVVENDHNKADVDF